MKFSKEIARQRRHFRVRKKIIGTSERPRLNVYKSNTNFYAQIIDDSKGATLLSVSTIKSKKNANLSAVEKCGAEIGKKALAANIKEVVFDRGGYQYHGQVKVFAEAVRTAGLKF